MTQQEEQAAVQQALGAEIASMVFAIAALKAQLAAALKEIERIQTENSNSIG